MYLLNLLVLRCRDIERSKSFYECLGLRFEKHNHGKGPEHYAAEDQSGVFELYPMTRATEGDLTGLGFAARDLEALAVALNQLGFAPEAISEKAWGKTFVVRDPDGRRVEVKESM